MKKTNCGVSGVRPHKLPFEEHSVKTAQLQNAIERQIRNALSQGFLRFYSGGAMGVDIWFAEIVDKLKSEYPHIKLCFILPCETQANSWPAQWRERYDSILAKSDEIQYVQRQYSRGCMIRRNRLLVDTVDMLIAVHDRISQGGTAFTCRYAKNRGVPTVYINPNDLMRVQT